jgi:hypothetical protein
LKTPAYKARSDADNAGQAKAAQAGAISKAAASSAVSIFIALSYGYPGKYATRK